MKFRKQILLLLSILSTCQNSLINEKEETKILPGLVLYRTGEVSFIEGYLDLIVSLECPSDVKETVIKTTKLVNNVKESFLPSFETMFLNVSITQRAHQWEFKLMTIRVKVLAQKLNEVSELPWISARSRKKRAAFEFGGDVLNILFGTATDKQVKLLRKKINILGNYASTSNLLITELKEQLKANTRTLINFRDSLRKLIEFQTSLSATHNIINQLGSIRALVNLIEQAITSIHTVSY